MDDNTAKIISEILASNSKSFVDYIPIITAVVGIIIAAIGIIMQRDIIESTNTLDKLYNQTKL